MAGQANQEPAVVLTIAGFDPTGGAGVTADLKTFAAHGCYGVSAVTAVAVQDTQTVTSVEPMPPAVLKDQLEAIFSGLPVSAVKIGMLANAALAGTVASALEQFRSAGRVHVVLDPVLRSSSGAELLDAEGVEALKKRLLPLVDVITPNRDEAFRLAGIETNVQEEDDAIRAAAQRLTELGAQAVVVTGGDADPPVDWLYVKSDGGDEAFTDFPGEKIESVNTHGTGCAFSSALAVNLAAGRSLPEAVAQAKAYVTEAIRNGISLGSGKGVLNHFHGFATGEKNTKGNPVIPSRNRG